MGSSRMTRTAGLRKASFTQLDLAATPTQASVLINGARTWPQSAAKISRGLRGKEEVGVWPRKGVHGIYPGSEQELSEPFPTRHGDGSQTEPGDKSNPLKLN